MKVRDKLAFGEFWSDRSYLLSRAKFLTMAEEVAALAAALGRPPRVLDAGIGRCRIQRILLRRHPGTEVVWHGLDLLARRLLVRIDVPGIHRVRGDVNRLPYADACFDAVACSWVLQHLRDPDGAVRELARVLRPGGLLLLAVPSAPQPLKVLRELVHPWWSARVPRRKMRPSYEPQIQFYNLPRVRRLARAAGCEPVRWQGAGFITGGPLRFLEDREWYYRWNLWLGRRVPRLTKNLVCVARGPDRAPAEAPSRPLLHR
jgi:ubiquinone/menaquinone biosynthesis C-methylase UbiE